MDNINNRQIKIRQEIQPIRNHIIVLTKLFLKVIGYLEFLS